MIDISKKKNEEKEIYFLIYFDNIKDIEGAGEVKFQNEENCPKCVFTKKTEVKGGNERLIKIFKYIGKTKDKFHFSFLFEKEYYNFTLEKIKETFIFYFVIFKRSGGFQQKYEQNKLGFHDKMNYFIEYLNKNKEIDKLDILYKDSISIYSNLKKSNFHFLINIFVNVYNTNFCALLLEKFSKNKSEPALNDKIVDESLEQYKYYFDDICKNADDIISSYKLNKIDFYGLILCYLNNYINEKYGEIFNELYKSDKNVLFEIMLKYKLYFKKKLNLDLSLLEEIIQFSASKNNFTEFKNNALYYLKDIDTLLSMVEKNKEKIIKIKDFEPIEVGKIENSQKIDFEEMVKKLDYIFQFSEENAILLCYLKCDFWESLAKRCAEVNMDNIKICYRFRERVVKYSDLVNNLIKDKKSVIYKDITIMMNKLIFEDQLNLIIKDYINSQNITNIEIIDLIKNYALFYHENNFINKREPEILDKIDIDKIDDDFIQKFEDMEFEEIFKEDLSNFLLIFLNKIQKIADFDNIIKLIHIKKLGNETSMYLRAIKTKYNIVIKEFELSEEKDLLIQSISNLVYYLSINEDNIEFLEKNIKETDVIDQEWKHKIYISLVNICKNEELNENDLTEDKETNKKKRKKIIQFLCDLYSNSLKQDSLKEFVEFLMNLKKENSNDLIEHLDNKYIITKNEFYSSKNNLNIQLLNLIYQKLNLKNGNQYIEKNILVLQEIYKDIEGREIKLSELSNLCNVEKDKIIEKLNILTLLKDKNTNPDNIYFNLLKYYQYMKSTLEKLMNYKSLLEIYHKNLKKKEISNLDMYIVSLQKGTYQANYKKKAEIQTLMEGLQKTIEKVIDVKDSELFKIFCRIKQDDKNKIDFEKAYSQFGEFKKKIAEKKAESIGVEINKDEIFKEILDKYYNNNEEIQRELNSLIYGKGKNNEEFKFNFK